MIRRTTQYMFAGLAVLAAMNSMTVLIRHQIPRGADWPTSVDAAPNRRPGDGVGPYERLVIRGVKVIEGTGAPARGPMDIVIERNRIVEMRDAERSDSAGAAAGAWQPRDRGERDVRPAWIHRSARSHWARSNRRAGGVGLQALAGACVTTVREPGLANGVDWTLRERTRSAANQIVAPRIYAYVFTRLWDRRIETSAAAREFVRWVASKGADGLKLGLETPTTDPEIMAALIDEVRKLKLGTQAHLAPVGVTRTNALDAARLGLGSLEHWYGPPEALLSNRTVQDYPDTYNYNNEIDRFGEAGRLWKQTVAVDSDQWKAVRDEVIALRLTLNPTMTVYEKARDASKAMRQEWTDAICCPHNGARGCRTARCMGPTSLDGQPATRMSGAGISRSGCRSSTTTRITVAA